jgi:murein L,D-transpeptidase YcbB/YkuD
MIRLTSSLLSSCALIGIASAQHVTPAVPASEVPVYTQVAGGDVQTALQEKIMQDFLESYIETDLAPSTVIILRAVYAEKLFQPLWSAESASQLVETKRRLFDFGLIPDEVSFADLQTLSQAIRNGSTEERANADLKLSIAWLRMASAVSGGLSDEGETLSRINRPSRPQLGLAIKQAAGGKPYSMLKMFEPEHPQYQRLKQSLADYRAIASDGGWPAIQGGDTIRIGDIDSRIPALRDRLMREGYEAARPVEDLLEVSVEITDPNVVPEEAGEIVSEYDQTFDASLESALKAFQGHHGLEADGVLGANTLIALNESVASKIDRIADTMDRWRRHGDLGERYIWANIPSFEAMAWEDGTRQFSMRTIVGLPSRETPIFSDTVEYVVANPKWYAPISIVRRDKLPKLQKDPTYASRLNYKVYDRATGEEVSPALVDWTDPQSAVDYRLVQQSGDSNALGDLKIIFPNQYAVYLHGTPSPALFEKAQRAFSSGCIRLEDPAKMARWLARQDESVDVSDVTDALAEDETERIDFEQTTPVHITYMTVTVDEEDTPFFWRDIYDRDDGIEMAQKMAPLYEPMSIEEILDDPI